VACWCLGALSLLVNIALKQIPLDYFAFARHIDLENENEDEIIRKYLAKGEAAYK